MTWRRGAIISCALTLTASFALARIHPFGDAGLHAANDATNRIMDGTAASSRVRTILAAKCADCDSMRTRTLLYGRLAPASWLMDRNVVEVRREMNPPPRGAYSTERRQILPVKIAHEARSQEMLAVRYRMVHGNTPITDTDLKTFDQLAHDPDSAQTDSSPPGEGDPLRGKALFEKRCVGCHALAENHEGPRLRGVYGRTSGTVTDFAYSEALKKAHIVWDSSSLDKWLTDPDAFIPGNEMDFMVSKPQERLDLIAFLRQTSGN